MRMLSTGFGMDFFWVAPCAWSWFWFCWVNVFIFAIFSSLELIVLFP